MKKEEKEALKNINNVNRGLLNQSDLLNCLPNRDTKLSHSLITSGYLEETKRLEKASQIEITYYRLTEKGRLVFEPFYKQWWFYFKGDIRTVMVAVITTIVVSLIAKMFN